MTKFVVIDPCYLKHTDEEWNKYCAESDFRTGDLAEVFPDIYGVDIENGEGDISENEFEIQLRGNMSQGVFTDKTITLPCCDAGHHRIFAFEDVKDRLNDTDLKGSNYSCQYFELNDKDATDIFALADNFSIDVERIPEPYEE